jgi:hypothetical protein
VSRGLVAFRSPAYVADVSDAPVKDSERQLPVPVGWRSTFAAIVDSFVHGAYRLHDGVADVDPLNEADAADIAEYVSDYGKTLCELDEDTWQTSVALWMDPWWDVLVDLRTEEEGRSDLVLHAKVRETGTGRYRFTIDGVWVP